MVQREWDKRLSSLRESYQAIKDKLPMDLSHWSQSRNGRGRLRAALPVLALGRRSGRVPALPYPPPRLSQCTSHSCDWSTSLSFALARRLAAAIASFCVLEAQIASARPASLSAGVMYAMALCNRTVL